MIIDEGCRIYLPKNLKLLEISVEYQEAGDCLLLKAPGMKNLKIPLAEPHFEECDIKHSK